MSSIPQNLNDDFDADESIHQSGFVRVDKIRQADEFVARSVSWNERVGTMSVAMAKAICTDSQMSFLDPESLGLLVRIHAFNRIGRCIPADFDVAARILGMSRKKLEPALKKLMTMAPGFLMIENELLTAPILGFESTSAKKKAHDRYRDMALVRWRDDSEKAPDDHGIDSDFSPSKLSLKKKVDGKSAKSRKKDSLKPVDLKIDGLFGVPDEFDLSNESSSKDGLSAKIPPCPYQILANSFNEVCKSLSNVKDSSSWTPVRKSAMNNRWKERPDVAFWSGVFADVQRSDFLSGRQSAWRCGFDWIIKPANLQKILEGNFSNRGGVRRALWDQGDKTRNSDMLDSMQSEVDTAAPFMRVKPNEMDSSPSHKITEDREENKSVQSDDAASALKIPTSLSQNMPTAQRGVPLPSGGAGQAPAGFGIKPIKRPVSPVALSSTAQSNVPVVPVAIVALKPITKVASDAPVSPASSTPPASGFTPDRLRDSIRIQKTVISSIPEVSEIPSPSVPVIKIAEKSVENSIEKRSFRFRSAEQKGS